MWIIFQADSYDATEVIQVFMGILFCVSLCLTLKGPSNQSHPRAQGLGGPQLSATSKGALDDG